MINRKFSHCSREENIFFKLGIGPKGYGGLRMGTQNPQLTSNMTMVRTKSPHRTQAIEEFEKLQNNSWVSESTAQ